jgi:flagellar hook-length control protein FliK
MQDIFLSTPATGTGAAASGLAAGSLKASGMQTVEDGSTFGETLSGIFNTPLNQEKISEITQKLESLGVDESMLSEIGSYLSGNLMALSDGLQGISLPQLNTFIEGALQELEEILSMAEGQSGEGVSEDIMTSLFGVIDSIQSTLQTQSSAMGAMGVLASGNGDAANISISPSNFLDSQDLKKQFNNRVNQASVASLNTASPGQVNQGLQAENTGLSLGAGTLANLNGQFLSDNSNDLMSPTLSNDTFGKLMGEQLANGNSSALDSVVDKLVGNGVDKSSALGLKPTFTDVQGKLENTPYSTTVMTGVNDLEWGEEVSQKIVWLTGKAIQSAEIHLNPAELGPIDVKISVQNDSAAVTINAHNATVREMLESNVVRLREMMESNGVNLQEVNVDARQGDERYTSADQEQQSEGGHEQSEDGDAGEEVVSAVSEVSTSSNIVDYFA